MQSEFARTSKHFLEKNCSVFPKKNAGKTSQKKGTPQFSQPPRGYLLGPHFSVAARWLDPSCDSLLALSTAPGGVWDDKWTEMTAHHGPIEYVVSIN